MSFFEYVIILVTISAAHAAAVNKKTDPISKNENNDLDSASSSYSQYANWGGNSPGGYGYSVTGFGIIDDKVNSNPAYKRFDDNLLKSSVYTGNNNLGYGDEGYGGYKGVDSKLGLTGGYNPSRFPGGYSAGSFGGNRYAASGYEGNGYGTGGYGASGYGVSGYGASGYGASGYGASGLGTSGYGASGYGAGRYGTSGLGTSGYGAGGYGTSGYGAGGYGTSSFSGSGYNPNGYGTSGLAPGYEANGLIGNGGYGGFGGNGGLASYSGYNNPLYKGSGHLGYGYYNKGGYGNIYNSGVTPNLVTGYRGYTRR